MAASRHRAVDGVKLVTTEADSENFTWLEVLGRADLVVECAGVAPAGEYGPAVIAAGTDLVLTSVGDLADPSRPTGAQRCQGVFLLVGDLLLDSCAKDRAPATIAVIATATITCNECRTARGSRGSNTADKKATRPAQVGGCA